MLHALLLATALTVGETVIPAHFSGPFADWRACGLVPFTCDMTAYEGVSFEFACDDYDQFANFGLHFRSGGAWVHIPFDVPWCGGWTRIEIDKTKNRAKGSSFDWSKVDAIQFSGRRNGTKDTAIRVRNLQALPHLTPPPEKPSETENLAWLAGQSKGAAGELRGCYCHRATGPYPDKPGWDEAVRRMKDWGFNALFPNLAWSGTIFPTEDCLAACRKYGIQCHIWKPCFKAHREFKGTFPGRAAVNLKGETQPLLMCPSDPHNLEAEITDFVKLAKMGPDGIHLDYVRYGGDSVCFCAGCRAAFEKRIGHPVARWPEDVRDVPNSGLCDKTELQCQWTKFRQDNVTALVRGVSERVRREAPGVKISAAVFQHFVDARHFVAQDWVPWCREGLFDFICPMNYTHSPAKEVQNLRLQTEAVGDSTFLCPGLGLHSMKGRPDERARLLAELIGKTRTAKTRGFIVFTYEAWAKPEAVFDLLRTNVLQSVSRTVDFKGPKVRTDADRSATALDVGLKRLGVLRPKSVQEVGPSNFTIDGAPVDRDYADFDKYCAYLPALGVSKIRILTGWAKSEKVKGRIDTAWLEHIVDWCRAHGIEPLLELSYGNPIYEGGGGPGLADGIPNKPEGLAAWDRWVEHLARTFAGRVNEWAMWNEPDNKPKPGEQPHTPEQIAAFNVRSARILKRVMPDCRLHALSLAHNDPVFLEKCLVAFGPDVKLFDTFIYHGYVVNPDSSYVKVEQQKALLRKYAPHARLRQGENGSPSEWIDRLSLSRRPWTELSQAKWDLRRMLGDLGHDVESGLFCFVDINYAPPMHPYQLCNRKGYLRTNAENDVIRIKRIYYAVQNAVSIFNSNVSRVREKPQALCRDGTVSLYEYRTRAGSPLLVFWEHGPVKTVWRNSRPEVELDPGAAPTESVATRTIPIEWAGEALRDPVWVDLVTGWVYEIPADRQLVHPCGIDLVEIPVYDSPCVLTERAALDFVGI